MTASMIGCETKKHCVNCRYWMRLPEHRREDGAQGQCLAIESGAKGRPVRETFSCFAWTARREDLP